MLLTLGMLGLVVELWTPGAIVPGVVGGLCVLLAFFAFQALPINATGLLLIAFGVVLLILELKVPSFGVLGTCLDSRSADLTDSVSDFRPWLIHAERLSQCS